MNNPHKRPWDWPLAALFVLIFFTSSGRLLVTRWADDLARIQTVAVLGTLLGLALTNSRFSVTIRRLLVAGYTLGVVPWQMTAIITSETSLLARLASVWGRMLFAWEALTHGEPVKDPLFFILLASLFYWFLAILCAQRFFEREKLLTALIPPTLPLLIVQYYDGNQPGRIWAMAFYFLVVLLIFGRINLLENKARWKREGVFLGNEPGFDLNQGMMAATTLIILLAWVSPTPATALPEAARWWRSVTAPFKQTQENLGDALAALKGQPTAGGDRYSSSLALGASASQGQNELFRATAPQAEIPRFYWRARIYDQYENGVWRTLDALARPFSPLEKIFSQPENAIPTGEFTFEWRASDQRSLILPGQAVWVSRTANLIYFSRPDGNADALYLQAAEVLRSGDQYTVRAGLNSPTLQALRAAPQEMPGWVQKRYLQTPPQLTGQLRALALDITREQENSYDKAAAITAWLRANMHYSATIEAPPPGADPVTWFLFTWKSGFCNYDASAEVLLLRSIGIPARMVVGYAQGEAVSGHIFIVRPVNAHAWPEVYFSGLGWVEFEPTASQPTLNRPSGIVISRDPQNGTPADEESKQDLRRGQDTPTDATPTPETAPAIGGNLSPSAFGLWVIIVLSFGLILFWLWRARAKIHFSPRLARSAFKVFGQPAPVWLERWVVWSERAPEEHAFHAINQALSWLGARQPLSATPAERVEALKRLTPQVSESIDILAAQHEAALFGRLAGNASLAQKAARQIRLKTLQQIISRWLYGA